MAKRDRHLRGSTELCPKCGCRKVAFHPFMTFEGYGPGLACCLNTACKAIWEPFDPELIWDPDDPFCSFREPCNNCAFRPGSNEQQDREKWLELIGNLKKGGQFYCHKGVPIEADAEHGFAYPTLKDGTPDRRRLRLCRGYLNALAGLTKHLAPEKKET